MNNKNKELEVGKKVLIQARSSFNGAIGTISAKSNRGLDNMILVTLVICGRLFENVPFMESEVHLIKE